MGVRSDRQIILARRALLVASAISGLTSRAAAQAACPERRVPSDDELAAARKLYTQAEDSRASADYDTAVRALEQAYALTTNPRLLVSLAQVLRLKEDWARAHRRASMALSCSDELTDEGRDTALAIQTEAEAKIARIAVETDPEGAELTLDGEVVGTTPLAEPLVVAPGRTALGVRWPALSVSTTQAVVVEAGQQVSVRLVAPTADPCLNEPCVCLQPYPCLEPPLDKTRRPRFGVGVGYAAWLDVIDDGFANSGHGARAEFFFDFPLGDAGGVRLGLETLPARVEAGTLVPVGLGIGGYLAFRPLLIGASESFGYLYADDDGSTEERRIARSGMFVQPELWVGVELSERFLLGARGGPFFSFHEMQRERELRAGWISAGLFLTYSFGHACQGYGDPVPCSELEPMLARFP